MKSRANKVLGHVRLDKKFYFMIYKNANVSISLHTLHFKKGNR